MTYIIRNFVGFGEEDNFENGCLPGTSFAKSLDISFTAESKSALLSKVQEWFDVDRDALELDACEEKGRIDIALMETDDGYGANAGQIELWKEGRVRLYYVVYSGTLEQITDLEWGEQCH